MTEETLEQIANNLHAMNARSSHKNHTLGRLAYRIKNLIADNTIMTTEEIANTIESTRSAVIDWCKARGIIPALQKCPQNNKTIYHWKTNLLIKVAEDEVEFREIVTNQNGAFIAHYRKLHGIPKPLKFKRVP